ncbi:MULTISPECIES: hypothetical protein [Curtobacterium]|uniref:Uncharacterized protein n=1 Tax=Curtobacterium oceanosedimentum TaxID=465820 RepID=A0A147DQ39_9MICO|nr:MULTISPECIES: hypothetical protein [Curtobacterium]KTR51611.1 hypothetical protein NS359_09615 [Curtobacterium oceanosedimentum]UBQ02894.1 hypothetical protein LCG91_01610 [Curtobacterium sp. TXMA1]
MDVGWVSAVVALVGAAVAAASVVVTVVEGRRTRRNTEFSVHRDLWWQRWTWVVERALSRDPVDHDVAALMTYALATRSWVTRDDEWVLTELEKAERRRLRRRGPAKEDERDDHG